MSLNSTIPIPVWVMIAMVVLLLVIGIWLFLRVIIPAKKVKVGMELLSGQETNNRLRLTGHSAADRVVRLFNVLMDRLQEQTIRNREQDRLLSELIEVSPMGILIMDYDGKIVEANPSSLKFLDVNKDQVIGKGLEHVPGKLSELINKIKEGKHTLRVSETEIYLVRKLSLIDRGFSRPFVLIDNMADEVRRVEKEAYAKVIRVMAHEVNNTMGGLKSLLETLSEVYEDDPLVYEVISSGRESCLRLGDFVNSYAEVVRVPNPDKTCLELRGFLQRKLPFLQGLVGSRAKVCLDMSDKGDKEAEESFFIMADMVLLERVLVNVIKNAAEAIPPDYNGKIRIHLEKRKHEIELVIANNGAPIPKEKEKLLFKPFYTTKRGGRGTGLALIAEILTKHGWKYNLSTEMVGDPETPWTNFRIRISG